MNHPVSDPPRPSPRVAHACLISPTTVSQSGMRLELIWRRRKRGFARRKSAWNRKMPQLVRTRIEPRSASAPRVWGLAVLRRRPVMSRQKAVLPRVYRIARVGQTPPASVRDHLCYIDRSRRLFSGKLQVQRYTDSTAQTLDGADGVEPRRKPRSSRN